VRADFREMARWGFNAVRTYTVPPQWLLDEAEAARLRVLAGLSWTQHVACLGERGFAHSIREEVRRAARSVARHPALLGFTIGNEIPAPLVRWEGRERIERFLEELYHIVKSEDPEALTTYVNYPTTEYLELPFLDFVSFNVYLEDPGALRAYLARLNNLAGNRPLVMAEIGLDSRRNGLEAQAASLELQVSATLASGAAGAFVFKWTDEWHRGGFDVEDWDFGLTTRDREPKPALSAVSAAFQRGPFSEPEAGWPNMSVVCCSFNGAATIRRTLEAVTKLDYPSFETIVVDDGSTDDTARIAAEYPVRVISTENRGLSSARNTGAQAAQGEIVVYIDDDAFPESHWLHFLARGFREGSWAAIGGPNILPPGSNGTSECVSHAPGAPAHVLMTDHEAEHIPGCNFAIRRECLEGIGGFDARFRAAGDDVDLCWRIQERGWKVGFHPGAAVFHHSRSTVRQYWRQQRGYGRAEALLERKWPEKYNTAGHLTWTGRLYGNAFFQSFGWAAPRIYFGTWGSAPFQALYHPSRGLVLSVAMMPEWHLLIGALLVLSLMGALWSPLLLSLPVLLLAAAVPVSQALSLAIRASRARPHAARRDFLGTLRFVILTTWLHLIQPLARLWGRFGEGLTPWRRQGLQGWTMPRTRTLSVWSESWRSTEDWVERLRERLRSRNARPIVGGPTDRWDLEVRGGLLGGARILLAVEEHGAGKQYVRARVWPHIQFGAVGHVVAGFALLAGAAFIQGEALVGGILGGLAAVSGYLIIQKCGAAVATLVAEVRGLAGSGDSAR
jgi:GT2 family glycosyltransferase